MEEGDVGTDVSDGNLRDLTHKLAKKLAQGFAKLMALLSGDRPTQISQKVRALMPNEINSSYLLRG